MGAKASHQHVTSPSVFSARREPLRLSSHNRDISFVPKTYLIEFNTKS